MMWATYYIVCIHLLSEKILYHWDKLVITEIHSLLYGIVHLAGVPRRFIYCSIHEFVQGVGRPELNVIHWIKVFQNPVFEKLINLCARYL